MLGADDRDGSARGVGFDGGGRAVAVDEPPLLSQPQGQLERRVNDRAAQRGVD
jgi:hypothetical protein